MRSWVIGALALVCGSSVAQTNQGAILFDGDDEFSYAAQVNNGVSGALLNLPTTSTAGGSVAMNFNVGTAGSPAPRPRHVTAGNWFYRVLTDSRERHLANANIRTYTGDTVDYRFNQVFGAGGAQIADLTGRIGFELTDTGPNSSLVTTYMCFYNSSQTDTYTIQTFLAVDFSLGGDQAGDIGLGLSGARRLDFVDGLNRGVLFGPGAIGSATGTSSLVLGAMTDGFVNNYTHDPNSGGLPAGDLQGLLQFELIVPPGQEICSPAYIGIGIGVEPPVPEPATLAALTIGAVGVMARRRRKG